MNNKHNSQVVMQARSLFVSRFVALLNKRVDYVFEIRMFTLIFIGLPTIFTFLSIPLHAFGIISDLGLCLSGIFLALFAVSAYFALLVTHTITISSCIMQVFKENPTMRQILYQSADAQWADADSAYA